MEGTTVTGPAFTLPDHGSENAMAAYILLLVMWYAANCRRLNMVTCEELGPRNVALVGRVTIRPGCKHVGRD